MDDSGVVRKRKQIGGERVDETESLSDVDDREVAGYLNTKEETHFKRLIWERLNQQFAQQMAQAKKLKKETDDAKKAKSRGTSKNSKGVESQKRSSMVNYDALKQLEDELNEDLGSGADTFGSSGCLHPKNRDSDGENLGVHHEPDDDYVHEEDQSYDDEHQHDDTLRLIRGVPIYDHNNRMDYSLLITTFFSVVVFFFSFIASVVAGYSLANSRKKTGGDGKLPPGPWKFPVIGSMHHLAGSYPLRRLRELAKIHGPLMHVQLGEVSAIIASSPDMAKAVFKTHDLVFASRPKLMIPEIVCYKRSDIVFSPYGDYWRQMRKIVVLELLSNKNVLGFDSIRRDQLSRMLELVRSCEGRPVNLTEMIFRFTSAMTCRSAFGGVFERGDEFIALIKEVLVLLGGFDVADIFPSLVFLHGLSPMRRKVMRLHKKADAILDDVIDRHKKSLAAGGTGNGEKGGEDLIDVLLRLKRTGGLQFPITDDNIKAVAFDLFTAGTETSSMTIVWAMVEMLRNPRVLGRARAEVRGAAAAGGGEIIDAEELRYMKLVVKETLRLHPPSPLSVPRECMAETEMDGYTIPAGAWIMVNIQSIGRDRACWGEDAEGFVPERFESGGVDFLGNDFEFLPFGGGRRMCPGLSFGLANVYLPLANLLYHFHWELPRETRYARSLDLTETPGITAGKMDDLYLIPTAV